MRTDRALRRLRQMRLGEIACRGRQETRKWLDRSGMGAGAVSAPAAVEPLSALDPARFFEGATSARTPALVTELAPQTSRAVVDAAERALRGTFDLLGYRGLSFGEPIDWRRDAISGVRAPLAHWSRLDPLDTATVGDSKVPWELNRHQWLVTLGQAYRLTGDERYVDAVMWSVRDWLKANPYGRGINWTSSLEVALRLIAWCWTLFLVRTSPLLSATFMAEVSAAAARHATHVERYLSTYYSPNTHLTGEALGLFYAGVVFADLPGAARWREQGLSVLVEQSARQILPDGVYFEQSACYQRYTADFYLHALILAASNGLAVPAAVTQRLQSLLDCLLWVRRPDGSLPMFGDADGGWLLPLAPRAADDCTATFSTAAAFFRRADYAWAAGGRLAPETAWLLGPAAREAFEALTPAPPAAPASRVFGDGGHVVMRGDWRDDAHQMLLDVGPVGAFGHGHADLLSVQCAVFGAPCIVDPGTYAYHAPGGWRDHFRGTAAHSTLTVDGADQAVPLGPFGWRTRPRARLRRWESTDAFDFADAEHDAYHRLPDPVTHRRRVLFVKPRYWLVVDDVEGATEHRVDLRFQFAPLNVTVSPDLWARARRDDGRGLLLRPFAAVTLKAEVREGELEPLQGWISPDYGQRRAAPVLVYSAVTRLPLRILTLVLPVDDASAPPPPVSLVLAGPGRPTGLIFDASGERVAVHDGPAAVSLNAVTGTR